MTKPLFRSLLLAGLMAFSLNGYGQDSVVVRNVNRHIQEPLILIKPNVLVSDGLFPAITPNDILRIDIYKESNIPPLLRGMSSGGVVSIDYKKRVPSQSFTQVARQRGERGPFQVMINGRPLSTEQMTALRIASGAIGQVCVTPATPEAPAAVIAIELTRAKPVKHPPGSIFIR